MGMNLIKQCEKAVRLLEKHNTQNSRMCANVRLCCKGCNVDGKCDVFTDLNTCIIAHVLKHLYNDYSDNVYAIKKEQEKLSEFIALSKE